MLLEIENLVKKFDTVEALNIPQLFIEKGELFGIVGNNGAGKTTMFRLCLDLLKANTGHVTINNKNVATDEEWKKTTGSFID
jgi:ABC-2 type transport system ATP-binding protein